MALCWASRHTIVHFEQCIHAIVWWLDQIQSFEWETVQEGCKIIMNKKWERPVDCATMSENDEHNFIQSWSMNRCIELYRMHWILTNSIVVAHIHISRDGSRSRLVPMFARIRYALNRISFAIRIERVKARIGKRQHWAYHINSCSWSRKMFSWRLDVKILSFGCQRPTNEL